MLTVISASKLRLRDVEEKYLLQEIREPQFFSEWREDLPELSEIEMQILDRVKASYLYLSKSVMLENLVQMMVVSPLLDWAGFYQPPFEIESEYEVSLPVEEEDKDTLVKGRIDILVVKQPIWITVIESKRSSVSLQPAIPQALFYMLNSPQNEQPMFGLVTNGRDFVFLKLVKGNSPQYALSHQFTIDRGNDFHDILSILKKIRTITSLGT